MSGRKIYRFKRAVKAGGRPTRVYDLEAPLPGGFEGVVILDLSLGDNGKNCYLFSNRQLNPLRETLDFPELLGGMC